jgi:hypothetical protein
MCYNKGDYKMYNPIRKGFLGLGKIQLKPQPTLAMTLEVKKLIIEKLVSMNLATHEKGCELTETDQWMISRLTNRGTLTGEEIVQEILKTHRCSSIVF